MLTRTVFLGSIALFLGPVLAQSQALVTASTQLTYPGQTVTEDLSLQTALGFTRRERVPTGQTCQERRNLGNRCQEIFTCPDGSLPRPGQICGDFRCADEIVFVEVPCMEDRATEVETGVGKANVKVNWINSAPSQRGGDTIQFTIKREDARGLQVAPSTLTGEVAFWVTDRTHYNITPSPVFPRGDDYEIAGEIDIEAVPLAPLVNATSAAPAIVEFSPHGLIFEVPEVTDPSIFSFSLDLNHDKIGNDDPILNSVSMKPEHYTLSQNGRMTRVFVPMATIQRISLDSRTVSDARKFAEVTKKGNFNVKIGTSLQLQRKNTGSVAYFTLMMDRTLGGRPTANSITAKVPLKKP